MDLFERIGSSTENFNLELTIHFVKVDLPYIAKLAVIVKRGAEKRQHTHKSEADSNGLAAFNQIISFRTSMLKKGSSYLKKLIRFNLMMLSQTKVHKNGRGKIDISVILNSNKTLERYDVKLKNCTDKTALLCISAKMTPIQADSLSSPIHEEPNKNFSRMSIANFGIIEDSLESRDEDLSPSYKRDPKEKEKAKEKFMQRLKRLNTVHMNLPQDRSESVQSASYKPYVEESPIARQYRDPKGFEDRQPSFTIAEVKNTVEDENLDYQFELANSVLKFNENIVQEIQAPASPKKSELKTLESPKREMRFEMIREIPISSDNLKEKFFELEDYDKIERQSSPDEALAEVQKNRLVSNLNLPPTDYNKTKANSVSKADVIKKLEEKNGLTENRRSACSSCVLF